MKAVWILLLAVFGLPLASAVSFLDIGQARTWGQQFESGELNFLQLKMLLSLGREALTANTQEQMIRIGEGEEERWGWNVQGVQALLGEPTRTDHWVWIENKKESRRVPEDLPVWEKTIFNGSRIKISFFARPHAIEQENELLYYYWMDFDLRFKKEIPPTDFSGAQTELRQGFESYYATGSGLEELGRVSARLEQELHQQLSENRENCVGFLQNLFGTPPNETEKVEWKGLLLQGQNLEARLRADEWESEWHGLHAWIEINPQNEGFQIQPPATLETESRESLRAKTANELLQQFESLLAWAKQQAISIDATRTILNPAEFYSKIQTFGMVSDTLAEKANQGKDGFSMEQYQNELNRLFSTYTTDFSRQNVIEKNFRISLVRKTREVQNAFCRGQENPCNPSEACVTNACVSTRGGNENCENQQDDDGDTIVDCQDADCIDFLPCRRKCEPLCNMENGCWQCTGENCNQYCDLCGQCQNNNPGNDSACQAPCQSCSDCSNLNCPSVCEECWNCEDQYYGSGCRPDCKQCNECVQTSSGENCGTECRTCNICNYQKGNFQCGSNEQFNETSGGCEPLPCPEGQHRENEQCVQDQSQGCPEGQHLENGVCVQNQQSGCPEGQHEENGQCVQNQPSCPEGEHWENTVCCPDGYHEEAGRCGINVPSCPEGQVWCETECRTAACSNDSQCDDQDPLTTDICQNAGSCIAECTHQTGKFLPFSKWFGILSITGLATLPAEPAPETGPGCEQVHCSVNQYCNAEKGWCECEKGYWDCDGDWQNGCESTDACPGCTQDSDCAPARCSEDKQRVVQFQCVQEGSYTEEIANAEIGGVCKTFTSGETGEGIWVGAWGEKFDSFEPAKQASHAEFSREWCQRELDSFLEERKQLQENASNTPFEWFFQKFVETDIQNFEKQAQALFSVYDAFQRVNGDIARSQECLGQATLPSEMTPIHISFQSGAGQVEIWEKKTQTSFFGKPVEVLSPYMRLWIFPNKEQFKAVFQQEMESNKPGPTPSELAELSRNPQKMEVIRSISNAYGGEAKFLILVQDQQEPIMQQVLTISPQELIKVEMNQENPADLDVRLSMSYDFFYNTMTDIFKNFQKNQIVYPYWEQQNKPFNMDEALIAIQMFGRILVGVASGDVQVDPFWQAPGILLNMQSLIFLMGR